MTFLMRRPLMLVATCLLVALVAHAQELPAPVTHYPLSENTGAVAPDVAGNTSARLNGAMWVKSEKMVALDLDGIGNTVECGDPPPAHLRDGSLSFAVCFRTNIKAQQYVLTHGGWSLYLDNELRPTFETRAKDNDKWEAVGAGTPVPVNEWVQVACVYDEAAREARVYINGALANKGAKQPGFGGINRSKLALGAWTGSQYFNGLLGDTRIWNVALTDAQVAALYQQVAPTLDAALQSPRQRMSPKLHPFTASGMLDIDVTFRNLGDPVPEPGGVVELVREGKTEATKSGALSADGRATVTFQTVPLPAGQYEVRATATSAGKPIEGSTCATGWEKAAAHPWWFASKEGLPTKVMAPWTPVRVQQSGATTSVKCWERSYDFTRLPLPHAVTSANQALLAEPMHLRLRTDAGPVKWTETQLKVRKQTPEAAVLEVRCASADVALWGLVAIGYDGMMRLDFSVLPRKALTVQSLTLEIPFAAERAKYLYYYPDRSISWAAHRPGAIPAEGAAMPFNPAVWIGDDKRGLQWFAESDQDWLPADPKRAIQITPAGAVTTLKLDLIGQSVALDPASDSLAVGGDKPAKELSYTCGFMATPVKAPERDAWDLRSTTLYADVYKAMEPGTDGKSQLDRMQAAGVKSLSLMDWTDILCYNRATDPDKLKRFTAECHQRSIQVLVYFGFQVSDAAPEFLQYMEDAANWYEPRPYSYEYGLDNYAPKPVQTVYRVCYQSLWEDFVVAGAARLVDEAGIDGVYLDGTTLPLYCYNHHHGCGYQDAEGQWQRTYTIFESHRFAQRLYAALRGRNPRAQVNLHNSAFMVGPSIAYATSLWDGEHLSAPEMSMTERLPLDMFRTEFMGHQWGVPQEFLEYSLSGDYRQKWGLTLLHDVPTRPYGATDELGQLPVASGLWELMDKFGRKEAKWHPYWKNTDVVTVTPQDVYVSLYRHPKNGALLVVDNLGKQDAEAQVQLNLGALQLSAGAKARDGLTGETVPMERGKLTLSLPSLGWRVVWVK